MVLSWLPREGMSAPSRACTSSARQGLHTPPILSLRSRKYRRNLKLPTSSRTALRRYKRPWQRWASTERRPPCKFVLALITPHAIEAAVFLRLLSAAPARARSSQKNRRRTSRTAQPSAPPRARAPRRPGRSGSPCRRTSPRRRPSRRRTRLFGIKFRAPHAIDATCFRS